MIVRKLKAGNMKVFVHDTRKNMGEQVAGDFSKKLKSLLKTKDEVNVVFAAAPSQSDFLAALEKEEGIDWKRVNVFHMDEYVGLSSYAPQSFARFVKTFVADRFSPKAFYAINGEADPEKECERYSRLLRKHKTDIVCLGIGENAHVAFNDPGEAKFWDEDDVKIVTLDEVCRRQQVHDKCFEKIGDVPKYALTLTVPALLRAEALFCTVPAASKADAVRKTVRGKIDELVPASILKAHPCVRFYCDRDSAALL
ncbi:MAG: glucosamine-6-phosphate deaminase [Clostridia bacterium]|nr:glucosamine-6-phosphate deaminase [Clostridia bacterium]